MTRDFSAQARRVREEGNKMIWLRPSRFWQGGRKPKVLQMDFETYSEVDLAGCGSYRYIEDEAPGWARGLPLTSDGYVGKKFYFKS